VVAAHRLPGRTGDPGRAGYARTSLHEIAQNSAFSHGVLQLREGFAAAVATMLALAYATLEGVFQLALGAMRAATRRPRSGSATTSTRPDAARRHAMGGPERPPTH
jgi:hypothetical protein